MRPQFGGRSFIQFDYSNRLGESDREIRQLTLSMSFRSYDHEGVLFHLGTTGNYFFVVSYNGGKGKSTQKYKHSPEVDVSDGSWHTFRASFNRQDVSFLVSPLP